MGFWGRSCPTLVNISGPSSAWASVPARDNESAKGLLLANHFELLPQTGGACA
jgi:hypothetical protein